MSSKGQYILERIKKPKRKEAKKFKGQGLRIVDDEDAIPDYIASYNKKGDDSDEYNSADELPQIAGVKDERPDEIIAKEQFGNAKWKQLDEDPSLSSALVLSKNYDDDDDLSPPRSSHGHGTNDIKSSPKSSSSLSKSKRKYSDKDLSPPRTKMLAIKQEKNSDDDLSPPRLRKDDSGDLSPPRRSTSYGKKRRQDSDNDLSPPRMRRDDSGDLSPPRRSYNGGNSRKRNYSGDISPPRNQRRAITDGRRHDSDADLSPPRLPKRKFDSPPPQSRNQRYSSPPRRYNNNNSRRDDSPPPSHRRHHRDSYGGEGNSRRSAAEPEVLDQGEPKNKALEKYVHGSSSRDSSRLEKEKTLEGKKAGLQRGANLKEELDELRRRDDEFFSQMDESISGRNATTRYRDKETGKLRDFEKEKRDKIEEDKKLAERKKQYDQWGKGLKQVEEIKSRVESALHEMEKPLARLKDDSDLDDYLKKQERDGDPMLKFIERKREKASGNTSRKPRYTGPAPMPNRFGIPPGYRWDGVDRSSGYEKEWFSKINSKKAIQDDAYKWSCEDL